VGEPTGRSLIARPSRLALALWVRLRASSPPDSPHRVISADPALRVVRARQEFPRRFRPGASYPRCLMACLRSPHETCHRLQETLATLSAARLAPRSIRNGDSAFDRADRELGCVMRHAPSDTAALFFLDRGQSGLKLAGVASRRAHGLIRTGGAGFERSS
jgi:hypothetical protein